MQTQPPRPATSDTSNLRVIGDYVLLEKIDSGGMGRVYKAVHQQMDRAVALKMMRLENIQSNSDILRFRREMRLAAQLSHPNIVTAYDAGDFGGILYLVMELLEGCDLAKFVKQRGPLPVDLAIDILVQAAEGLAYAHKQGVIHRDVKPRNLIIDTQGVVKVVDLGLARVYAPQDDETVPAEELTQSEIAMGTFDYAAPEQTQDARQADHRADIYSLGCTLHFLLTGAAPCAGQSLADKIVWHRDGDIGSLTAARSDVPDRLNQLYRRMLAKSPRDRVQSMREVIDELKQCQTAQQVEQSNHQATRDPLGQMVTSIMLAERSSFGHAPSTDEMTRTYSKSAARESTVRDPVTRAAARGRLLRVVGVGLLVTLLAAAVWASFRDRHNPVMPVPAGVEPVVVNSIGMDLTLIAPGEFLMGAPLAELDAAEDERPQHPVRISRPFYLGTLEVTQRQFDQVMRQGNPAGDAAPAADDLPAVNITWWQADEFCRKLSELPAEAKQGRRYRLPTEAEWEYACRAGANTPYAFGETLTTAQANFEFKRSEGFAGTDRILTMPVGSFAPNDFGLYDMHGNVWEWCSDRYGEYEERYQIDPRGPAVGEGRVIRGGGWGFDAASCRSARRQMWYLDKPAGYIGFRVVCELAR